MSEAVGTDTAKAALADSYRFVLGQKNTYNKTMKALQASAADYLQANSRLERFDGWPDEVEDYEATCVIEGAAPIDIAVPTPGSAIAEFSRNCSSSSEGQERMCNCKAARIASHMTKSEFAARTRHYSNFLGKPTSLAPLPDEEKLMESGRVKAEPYENEDIYTCHALTFADKVTGASQETRAEEVKPVDAKAAIPATAGELSAKACKAEGKSDAYCTCYGGQFKSQIIDKGTPNAAMAAALILHGQYLDEGDLAQEMTAMPQSDMTAGVMLITGAMSLGQGCE